LLTDHDIDIITLGAHWQVALWLCIRMQLCEDVYGAHAGTTRLMELAACNDVAGVEAMVQAASLAERDEHGFTALHWAAVRGSAGAASALLALGADANALCARGDPPLHWAAIYGRGACARELLRGGADACAVAGGYTALMLAARDDAREVAAALIEAGAPLDACSPCGWTAALLAASFGNGEIWELLLTAADCPAARRRLLDARLPRERHNGGTALHLAATDGHCELVELLLRKGADAQARDAAGMTPDEAARAGGAEGATLLLEAWCAKEKDER
jgi:hypothetical protein